MFLLAEKDEKEKKAEDKKELAAPAIDDLGKLVIKKDTHGKTVYFFESGKSPEEETGKSFWSSLKEDLFSEKKISKELAERLEAVKSIKAIEKKEVQVIPVKKTSEEEMDKLKQVHSNQLDSKQKSINNSLSALKQKLSILPLQPVSAKTDEKTIEKQEAKRQLALQKKEIPKIAKTQSIVESVKQDLQKASKNIKQKPELLSRYDEMISDIEKELICSEPKESFFEKTNSFISGIMLAKKEEPSLEQVLSREKKTKKKKKKSFFFAFLDQKKKRKKVFRAKMEKKPAETKQETKQEPKQQAKNDKAKNNYFQDIARLFVVSPKKKEQAVQQKESQKKIPQNEKPEPMPEQKISQKQFEPKQLMVFFEKKKESKWSISLRTELGYRLDASKAIFALNDKRIKPHKTMADSAYFRNLNGKLLVRLKGFVDKVVELKENENSIVVQMPYSLKIMIADEKNSPINDAYITILSAASEVVSDVRGNVIWVTPTPNKTKDGVAFIAIDAEKDNNLALMLKVIKTGFKETQLILNPEADSIGEISYKRQLVKNVKMIIEEEKEAE